MTDKITGPSSGGASGSYPGIIGPDRSPPSTNATAGTTATRSTPANTETVSLTEDAALLQALDEQIAATPAVNAARVEEVRTALANGEYRIDPERVAEKLLAAEGGIASLLFRN
ncbi:MAG: flagellar biosynthesis anti-sigma factor FlgM [Pseudomonadota bacterium]